MFVRLILLAVLVGAVWWFMHWFRTTPPEKIARLVRQSLLYGVIGVLVLAAATGRLNPLFAALAAAVPLALRVLNLVQLVPLVRRALGALGVGGDSAQSSTVSTKYLEMTLDHASGQMDGRVLAGQYAGHRLSELGRAELDALLHQYRQDDAESARLLQAYLARTYGDETVGPDGAGARTGGEQMTRDEAFAVLGLQTGASTDEIRAAHRRLMQRFHPDRGGSDYIAAKINEAKRLLLDEA